VLELQEQRSQQFSRLDKMVKAYCESLDKSAFDVSSAEITQGFGSISESIRKIEKSLLENEENKEAFILIRKLQEQEKEHLQQVLQHLRVRKLYASMQRLRWESRSTK